MFDLVPFTRGGRSLFQLFDDMERNFFGDFGGGLSQMRTDVLDKGDRFVIQAELPGFDKKDIKIEVTDNFLTISAEHREENEQKKDRFIQRERRYGSFVRRFDVSDINVDGIAAEYKNGVLELSLPKNETKPRLPARKIDIS